MIEQISKQAARTFAAHKDHLVREAINRELGEDWDIEDLARTERIQVMYWPNGTESVALDGKSIIQFGPEIARIHEEGLGENRLELSQSYTTR
ncbi:MAG: hypothetical protein GWN58_54560 [Anaerolineae bacterium]|nr:hypothetical protein [Anaerolineae bacterium]